MRVIQISIEEDLLANLDATEQVVERGRSAVIREAVRRWLAHERERRIVDGYRRAYADGDGLGPDWVGWDEEGAWPDA